MKGLGSIDTERFPLSMIPPMTGHLWFLRGSTTPFGVLAKREELSNESNWEVAESGRYPSSIELLGCLLWRSACNSWSRPIETALGLMGYLEGCRLFLICLPSNWRKSLGVEGYLSEGVSDSVQSESDNIAHSLMGAAGGWDSSRVVSRITTSGEELRMC